MIAFAATGDFPPVATGVGAGVAAGVEEAGTPRETAVSAGDWPSGPRCANQSASRPKTTTNKPADKRLDAFM